MITVDFPKIYGLFKQYETKILVVLFCLMSFTTIYYRNQWKELSDNPQKAVQAQNQRLIDKVAKLVVLPENEQPTIATVTDLERLKDQPFFAKARPGFKVLIYASIGKSVLYDPFNNQVVEVASLNVAATPSPAPSVILPIRR